jgi:chromosome segregation ATPase
MVEVLDAVSGFEDAVDEQVAGEKAKARAIYDEAIRSMAAGVAPSSAKIKLIRSAMSALDLEMADMQSAVSDLRRMADAEARLAELPDDETWAKREREILTRQQTIAAEIASLKTENEQLAAEIFSVGTVRAELKHDIRELRRDRPDLFGPSPVVPYTPKEQETW